MSRSDLVNKAIRKSAILGSLGQHGKAVDLLRQVLQDEPDNLEIRLALKDFYLLAGQKDMAANEWLHIGRIRLASRAAAGSMILDDKIRESPARGFAGSIDDFGFVTNGERRLAERISMRLPLLVIPGGGAWREYTETVDISEFGMKLRLAHSVAPMTKLSLTLELTKWPENLARFIAEKDTSAVVRHSRKASGDTNLVGVELWPDETSSEALALEQLATTQSLSLA